MPSIARPAFPDDDGSTDALVGAELESYAAGGSLGRAVAALGDSRLLVPVVAVGAEGQAERDKEADMAAVLMTGADGRRALLAFTGLDAMRRWDPSARPVPVRTPDAATAAIADGAEAIVVDVAGPVRVVLEGDDLTHLAAGDRLVRAGDSMAWIRT